MEAAEGELGTTKKFLTAKFQIGSCKGPTNYNAQETVFQSSTKERSSSPPLGKTP